MRPIGLAVALALTRGPLPIEAQQAGKVYRIGWLGLGEPTPTTNKLVREPFLSRLKTHGWSEGQDFVMEYRSAPSVEDRKSTRLNSSHTVISYAVFCLKKKTPSSSTPRRRRTRARRA